MPLTRFVRPGTDFWDWPTQFFFSHVPRLVAKQACCRRRSGARSKTSGAQREREPGTFLQAPPMIGIVAEKE